MRSVPDKVYRCKCCGTTYDYKPNICRYMDEDYNCNGKEFTTYIKEINIMNDPLTRDKHIERHKLLHRELDELMADYFLHGKGSLHDSILKLVTWSNKQTENPNHEDKL